MSEQQLIDDIKQILATKSGVTRELENLLEIAASQAFVSHLAAYALWDMSVSELESFTIDFMAKRAKN